MNIGMTFLTFIRRKKKSVAAIVVAVLLVVGGLEILPDMGLRWGLVKELTALGMASVHVGDTDLQLFGGRVVVRGVSAQPSLGEALGLSGLDVLVNWRRLLSKQVSVDKANVDGLSVTIHRKRGQLEINGINFLQDQPSSSVTPTPSTPQPPSTPAASPWSVDVTELHFQQGRIRYEDELLKLDVNISQLDIFDVKSLQPDLPARFHLMGTVNGHAVEIDGSARLFAPAPAFQVEMDVKGMDLAPFETALKAAGLDKLSGRVSVHAALSGDLAASPVLAVEAKAQIEALQLADMLQIDQAQISLSHAKIMPATGQFDGQASVSAHQAAWKQGGTKLSATNANLAFDSVSCAPDKGKADGKVSVAIDALSYEDASVKADPKQMAWVGSFAATLKNGALTALHQEGHFKDSGAAVSVPGFHYSHKALSMDVASDLSFSGAKPGVAATVSLGVDGFILADDKGRQTLVSVRHGDVDTARMDVSGSITVNRIQASDLKALKGSGYPWRVEAGSVLTTKASVSSAGAIAVGSVALNDATFRVTRSADGIVGLPAAAEPSTAKPQADTSAPLKFSLGRFVIGGKSRVEFEDKSLAETMRMSLANLALSVADLVSDRPNRDSAFDLKAQVAQATLTAKGTLRPFADQPTGAMTGTIAAFELPPLSPYASNALGVQLQTGHLDSDIKIEVDKGALNGKIQLTLSNLAVAEPQGAARLAKSTGMPLQTVLGLLKDDQDRIHLTVPVGGNISDPSYDVSDAVSQAIGGALRSTAATTLEILFPVAGLIDLLGQDGNGLMALDPIVFPPGKDELDKAQLERIATLGGLMKSRPQIVLTLCGIATISADWPVMLEQKKTEQLGVLYRLQKAMDMEAKPQAVAPDADALEDLASRRAGAIKAELTGQSGIDAGRLYGCHPTVETDPKAVPSVRLSL